jgi:hypothetical protein
MPPAAACLNAFRALAKAGDTTEIYDGVFTATLKKCSSLAEWLGGVQAYPETMGLESGTEIQWLDVDTACLADVQIKTPVCSEYARLKG